MGIRRGVEVKKEVQTHFKEYFYQIHHKSIEPFKSTFIKN